MRYGLELTFEGESVDAIRNALMAIWDDLRSPKFDSDGVFVVYCDTNTSWARGLLADEELMEERTDDHN